ncbi:MAG: hypothetical protein A3F10_07560 [Coxiella sp. RIFCSPHIGHO2_12_FULL_42_15]|nr:MAG: hypothetical protein A3F10_07560 [Coxiella sp. RIFCSPHIGHO2_12_FULL_42_15]
MDQYWRENPDLYSIIKKKRKDSESTLPQPASESISQLAPKIPATNDRSIISTVLRGAPLRKKINASHRAIRQHVMEMNADIIPRTQAHNRKCDYPSLEEERNFRADVVAEQIRAWRSMLPTLIKKFAKIPDYCRTTESVEKRSLKIW